MLALGVLCTSKEGQNIRRGILNTLSRATENVIQSVGEIYGSSEPENAMKSPRVCFQRSCSVEDLIPQIELQSNHPFVQTMRRLRHMFGEQWPPRASFSDWPEQWIPYKEMGEEMSYKLKDLDNPSLFRNWIDGFASKVIIKITYNYIK